MDRGPGCIAVTGIHTPLGRRLVARLAADPARRRILSLDRRRPLELPPSVEHHRVELARSAHDGRLAELLDREGVEAIVHLAFRTRPSRFAAADRELEVVGTRQLLASAADAGVRRLVVASTTMIYGAREDNPNFLAEDHPLRGHPDAPWVEHRVDVERQVAAWASGDPERSVCVLRGCWVADAGEGDPFVAFLRRATVPLVLGYDPLLQVLHENDWLHAFESAIANGVSGRFNVVGRGVAPISTLVRLAGRRVLPLPLSVLERSGRLVGLPAFVVRPRGFLDYLRFLWVADGEAGWNVFGEPVYSTREAWASLAKPGRLRESR